MAKWQFGNFKYDVANTLNVPLKQGYNGDLTSRQAGSIGGEMVKRMIQTIEQSQGGGTIR